MNLTRKVSSPQPPGSEKFGKRSLSIQNNQGQPLSR
jgi:hypothetical protein